MVGKLFNHEFFCENKKLILPTLLEINILGTKKIKKSKQDYFNLSAKINPLIQINYYLTDIYFSQAKQSIKNLNLYL